MKLDCIGDGHTCHDALAEREALAEVGGGADALAARRQWRLQRLGEQAVHHEHICRRIGEASRSELRTSTGPGSARHPEAAPCFPLGQVLHREHVCGAAGTRRLRLHSSVHPSQCAPPQ